MTSTNTYGRQVVVPLTNKSGGGVIAGDVVVVGTANNDAFTTTTSAGFTGTVGVAQETIADNATGRVLLSGYAALVNVTASVTRQNFGTTSTTVKQAVDAGASRTVGTFCQFLTGGTTPDAIVYPADLGSSSGSMATDALWDAAGDLAQGTGANTAAKLTAGTAGQFLRSAGAAAANTWSALPSNCWQMSISSSVTLTSGADTAITFDRADIDGGGSVIDLANDRFVVPATGFYMIIADWLWEGTAPVVTSNNGPRMTVTVGGTDTLLFRVPSLTPATAVFEQNGGYNASKCVSLTASDLIKLNIHPQTVTGCTARGNAAARLSTSLTLIRLT